MVGGLILNIGYLNELQSVVADQHYLKTISTAPHATRDPVDLVKNVLINSLNVPN